MFLSVIIPTRNRASYLASALKSITKQTYPNDMYEVLVIDNGSTDNTREVCNSFKSKIPNLHYFYDEKPGLHVGRHLGLKEAKADILVYADDDIEAFPTWLEGVAEAFQDESIVLVGGKNLPKFGMDPPDWIKKMWEPDKNGNRILGYLSILDFGNEAKEVNPYYVFGCNFSIKKNIIIEAGGFHPDSMPDELILYRGDGESHVASYIKAKAYKVVYNPKASVYHLVSNNRLTLEYYKKRLFREGISHSYRDIRNDSIKHWMYLIQMLVVITKNLFIKKGQIKKIAETAYKVGYRLHQKSAKKSNELYEWIKKPDYFI